MRITGGQITGGITFSSPEIPTITRWVFSEASPDFHFGVGNWDKFMASIRSVATEGANNRLLLDINWTGSFDPPGSSFFDETANAFLSGINTFSPSTRQVLSNAEALAIFEALPVGSIIDFNGNQEGNTGTILNLTYSGNASVFPYRNTVMLDIPVEGLDPSTDFLGGIRVYHPANVYDILAVTGPDTTANVGITRWVFGNRACVNPDVYFGAGNWDKYIPNSPSLVLSDVANSRLILEIQSVTAGTPGYPLDEAANAFMSGINLLFSGGANPIPCLSNAEALAIFEALPVGSRIDFANLSIIQNLTYSGNASVFIFNDIPSLSIPVEGLYVDFSTSGGSMLFYHPGNVYDILAVTGPDTTANVGITRWVFGNAACVTPDAYFGAGQWDENMQSTFATDIGADGANSRLILDIRGVTAAYNETANAFMSGPINRYNATSLSNAEALAIFEALPVGSIIDLSNLYTIQNLTYSGNASVFIFNVTPSVSISALSIPVEGLDPSYYLYPAGAIRVYHPGNVYNILAVTGPDTTANVGITRWAFTEPGANTQFGIGNWDEELSASGSLRLDYANSYLTAPTVTFSARGFDVNETANAFVSGSYPGGLSNAEILAIFEALPVGSRIDFSKNIDEANVATFSYTGGAYLDHVRYDFDEPYVGYYRQYHIFIPVEGTNGNVIETMQSVYGSNIYHDDSSTSGEYPYGGMLVHHPSNVYDILAVTGSDITRWVFSEASPDFHFGEGNWDKYMASVRSVEADSANSRIILNIKWTFGDSNIHGLFDETTNVFVSGLNDYYDPPARVLSNAEALAIFEALPVGSRIDFNHNAFGNLSTIQNLTYSGNTSFFLQYGTQPSLSIPVEGLDTNSIFLLGGIRVHHPGNVYNILAVTGGD